MAEGNKNLSNTPPLRLVGGQYVALCRTIDYGSNLPSQFIAVLHRNVHTLPDFGRMCMDGVSSKEDPVICAEAVADSLTNLNSRESVHILEFESFQLSKSVEYGAGGLSD
ncbi:MAG: hypothetical protein FRX48_04828 [Lasallia pustulata]|uniref:Uncharacterized protein n=1 Tax=Lasallia pustulata TaxID=136370 RepID=A0A5M8PPT7_9LECA|nr:MAG: hypothetical protein FRX48_04828 [Lasallia pustulata]